MNGSSAPFVRSIRGPILLITLGVLLVLDHSSAMSFWRTWPVLLIVLGVMILLERAALRTPPAPGSGYGGGTGFSFEPPGAPLSSFSGSTPPQSEPTGPSTPADPSRAGN